MSSELLLLLADGRFPGGGYAHSGGVEAAVGDGSIGDAASLAAFVTGRLATVGFTDAWLAAAACLASAAGDDARLVELDDECDARIAAPSLRVASESLGRGVRRSAAVLWPAVASTIARNHAVVLGVVANAAGLDVVGAARLALHHAAIGPACSAPKLFALDMADALAAVARVAPIADELAEAAAALAHAGGAGPVRSAPLIDDRAVRHANWEVRLFAT